MNSGDNELEVLFALGLLTGSIGGGVEDINKGGGSGGESVRSTSGVF